MQPFLSVVIPSYNEKSNIDRGVLEQVLAYLEVQDYSWELVLSDDGSTDGTVAALHAFASKSNRIRVIENIHAGKAPTVKSGMLAAEGQWRLFADFDQSSPLREVEKLVPWTKKGYSIVIGSREIEGALRDKEPFHRHMMGKIFNMVVQVLAVPGVHDTQCGFKLLSAQATEKLFNKLVIYGGQEQRKDAFTGAFDVELLYLALKAGFKIKEVPIFWAYNETVRVNPLKDSFRMLRDIVRIRLASLSGKYAK
jgi:glycosyltransferase involved in cell wall biosynthesis